MGIDRNIEYQHKYVQTLYECTYDLINNFQIDECSMEMGFYGVSLLSLHVLKFSKTFWLLQSQKQIQMPKLVDHEVLASCIHVPTAVI